MIRPARLHVVRSDRAAMSSPAGDVDRGDLAVLAMLLGVNLVPLVGAAVTRGGWGAGTLGLATAGALVSGRELALGARSYLRRGRERIPPPRAHGARSAGRARPRPPGPDRSSP